MKIKLSLTLIASVFLSAQVTLSAVGGSAVTAWDGKQYETEFKYSQFESRSEWDGASFPLPVTASQALGKTEKWMNKNFPSGDWRLGRMIFADFSHGEKKDLWVWLVSYNNQNRKVTVMEDSGRKLIEQDELVFYVLLDGTVLSPERRKGDG